MNKSTIDVIVNCIIIIVVIIVVIPTSSTSIASILQVVILVNSNSTRKEKGITEAAHREYLLVRGPYCVPELTRPACRDGHSRHPLYQQQ
jgi:hypothetical protein